MFLISQNVSTTFSRRSFLALCKSSHLRSISSSTNSILSSPLEQSSASTYRTQNTTTTASSSTTYLRSFSTTNMTNESSTTTIGLKQMFDDDSSTYTYMLWDPDTKDAILVDPVDLQVDRDITAASDLGLKLLMGVNTHCHADHVTGTGLLKKKVPGLQSVIAESSGAQADIKIKNGDKVKFGNRYIEARATPGHTEGCLSYVADDKSFVLTGDTMLIMGCGRTDFQGGSASTLYDSVQTQLFSLPDSTIVYPAHDYKGRTQSSIGDEKEKNPRLGGGKTKEEFVSIMDNLNLAYPKHIDRAVPANMRCGVIEED